MAKRKRKLRTIETDIFGYPVAENPINSNRKGKDNERTAAKWLSKWTGVPFTRVPSSGGLRWKDTANVCGDVVCEVDSFYFPFSVETKHLKRITFTRYLRANSSVFTVYRQAKEDADRAGKKVMMVLRKDGMPEGEYVVYFEQNDVLKFWKEYNLEIQSTGVTDTGVGLVGFSSSDLLSVKFDDLVRNL